MSARSLLLSTTLILSVGVSPAAAQDAPTPGSPEKAATAAGGGGIAALILLGLLAGGAAASSGGGGDDSSDADTPQPPDTPPSDPSPDPDPDPGPAPDPDPDPGPDPDPDPDPTPDPDPDPNPDPDPEPEPPTDPRFRDWSDPLPEPPYAGKIEPRYILIREERAYKGMPRPGLPAPRESFETEEYFGNWGLDAINAAARYADGAAGRGVLLTVITDGINTSHETLEDAFLLPHSYNRATYQDDGEASMNGGTGPTSVAVGRRGHGRMHGVAPEADLGYGVFDLSPLSHRERTYDIAVEGMILRSVQEKSRVQLFDFAQTFFWSGIEAFEDFNRNMSAYSRVEELEEAMTTRVAGALYYADSEEVVTVVPAGDRSRRDPNAFAAAPSLARELRDTWLTVTAIDDSDALAGAANKCGVAAGFCLAAPGEGVLVADPYQSQGYRKEGGTDIAAGHVAGAAALLISNFPELSGSDIVRLLKNSARDIGAPGVDSVFGHGALDLERAVAPQGQISVQMTDTVGDTVVPFSDSIVAGDRGITASLDRALSDARYMITDGYGRGYNVPANLNVLSTAPKLEERARSVMAGDIGVPHASLLGNDAFGLALPLPGSVNVEARVALEDEDARGLSTRIAHTGTAHTLGLTMGQVDEAHGMLGTRMAGAFDAASHTRWIGLDAAMRVSGGTWIDASYSQGLSDLSGAGLVSAGRVRSDGVRLGMRHTLGGLSLSAGMSQDISVSDGHLDIRMPERVRGGQPAGAAGTPAAIETRMTDRRVGLAESARPLTAEIGARFDTRIGDTHTRLGLGYAQRLDGTSHGLSAQIGLRF